MLRKLRWGMSMVLVLGLATACSAEGTGSAASNGNIRYGYYEGTMAGAMDLLTMKRGFLEEEGITAEPVGITDGAQMMAALIAGETDFSSVSPGFWPAIDQGECFRTYGNGAQQYYKFLATEDARIPGIDSGYPDAVKGMKGLRVGVVARGTATERLASLALESAGVDPKDVTFIATGGAQTSVTAFENGQIDVLFSYPPVDDILKENGTPFREVANFFDGEVDVLGDAMVTMSAVNCDYAEENPETVSAVCRAYHAAYEFARDPANKEEMQQFMAEAMNVSPEIGKRIWDTYGAAVYAAGPTPTEKIWNAQTDFYPGVKQAPAFDQYAMTECD